MKKLLLTLPLIFFCYAHSSFASVVTWYRILMTPAGYGQYYLSGCAVANNSPLYWINSGVVDSYKIIMKNSNGKVEIARINYSGPMGNVAMYFRKRSECEIFLHKSESAAKSANKKLNNEFN